jgi:hypothetical protein
MQSDRREAGCANCGTDCPYAYCANCGQKNAHWRIPFRDLTAEYVKALFKLDARTWRSLPPLLWKPGLCTSEFVAGRRMQYDSPFRLLAIATAVYAIGYKSVHSQGDLTVLYAAIAAPLNVVLFTFVLALLHPFRKSSMVDHLVHSTHLFAFAFLALGHIWFFARGISDEFVVLIMALASMVYFSRSLSRVYAQPFWLAFSKTWIGLPAFWFLFIPVTGWIGYYLNSAMVYWWYPELTSWSLRSPLDFLH